MNRLHRAALTIAIASVAVAPAAAQTRAPAPAPLTTADTNRLVAVRVGSVLKVSLRQAAGNGSSWRMVPAAGLIQVGPPVVAPVGNDGPPIIGGPETHLFRVRVTAPGELVLTFVNVRSFGGTDQRAETVTFVLEAK